MCPQQAGQLGTVSEDREPCSPVRVKNTFIDDFVDRDAEGTAEHLHFRSLPNRLGSVLCTTTMADTTTMPMPPPPSLKTPHTPSYKLNGRTTQDIDQGGLPEAFSESVCSGPSPKVGAASSDPLEASSARSARKPVWELAPRLLRCGMRVF